MNIDFNNKKCETKRIIKPKFLQFLIPKCGKPATNAMGLSKEKNIKDTNEIVNMMYLCKNHFDQIVDWQVKNKPETVGVAKFIDKEGNLK